MRISDWSSDVCSSDLRFFYRCPEQLGVGELHAGRHAGAVVVEDLDARAVQLGGELGGRLEDRLVLAGGHEVDLDRSSDARRVGQACVSTCRSRWSPSL